MHRFLKLPRYPFTRAMIEHAPEDYGVYGLFEGDQLIYVGRAAGGMSIRTCLLLHQDGAMGVCTVKASACAWELTPWRKARETEILARFLQEYRRDPRCQRNTAR